MMPRARSEISAHGLPSTRTGREIHKQKNTPIGRMPSISFTALIILASSSLFFRPASSAPTPQDTRDDDVITVAQLDGTVVPAGVQLDRAEPFNGNIESDPGTSHYPFRRDSPAAKQRSVYYSHGVSESVPSIHIIDNSNTFNDPMTSSFLFRDYQQAAASSSTTSSPPPWTITPHPTDQHFDVNDSEMNPDSDWVFNVIIQQQRKQRSAFIAPDVNWLRDLVPKVVDVVDKSEMHIRDTVFDAVDDDNAGSIKSRQIFVNVVKSSVQSENEVPKILKHLRELVQTGGPAVNTLRAESRDGHGHHQSRSLVINIIIFNIVLGQDPSSTSSIPTPATFFRDSYLEALEESHNTRQAEPTNPTKKHKGPHFVNLNHAPILPNIYKTSSDSIHSETSTHRALMVMEKDYFRPAQTGQSVDSTEDDYIDVEEAAAHGETENDDLTPVESPPTKIVPATPRPKQNKSPTTAAKTKKPTRVRGAMNTITTTAGNMMRNRVRTVGFVAVPLMAGLAGTVNMWLPAVAALGRRKRSVRDSDQFEEQERAIEDPGVLALLLGKRYMNLTRESLQESIDNWKNRDQEANDYSPSSGDTKLASTSRPQWIRFPSNQLQRSTVPSGDATSSTTVKRSTDPTERITPPPETKASTTLPQKGIFAPLFYSALFNSALRDQIAKKPLNETEIVSPVSTDSVDDETAETEVRELANSVTPTYQIQPPSSGFDFDIVANFVKSTLSKMGNTGSSNPEDKEIFIVKAPSIVNRTSGSDRLPPFNDASTVNLFTAEPIMPMVMNENVTNSPVTYVSMRPAAIYDSAYEDDEYNDGSDLLEEIANSTPQLVEVDDIYYSKQTYTPTTPIDEYSTVKWTNNPVTWVTNPSESLNSVRPVTNDPVSRPPSTTRSMRPPSLLTINSFKTPTSSSPLPPPSVDVSSGQVSTLKFNHNGIVTSPPLLDYSTLTGESALVSVAVDKQNMVAGILKGMGTSPNPYRDPVGSSYDSRPTYTNSYDQHFNRPIDAFMSQTGSYANRPGTNSFMNSPNVNYDDSSSYNRPTNAYDSWSGGSSVNMYGTSSPYDTATYDPFSTTGITDELDVTSVISQLQTNLTTGLVTKSPVGGLHFVNSTTDIVIINPLLEVTPSSAMFPLDIEAVEADPADGSGPIPIEAVVVEADGNAPAIESVPQVSQLANLFFPVVSSSSSSDSSSSSGSVTSVGELSSSSSTSGFSPLATLGVFGAAAASVFTLSLPFWVPFVAKKKKRRRTYGVNIKKKKKHNKKTYGPPKKTYGEPPVNHYKESDDYYYDGLLNTGSFEAESYRSDDVFDDPGPLVLEDFYGPPADIILDVQRRRRSDSNPRHRYQ